MTWEHYAVGCLAFAAAVLALGLMTAEFLYRNWRTRRAVAWNEPWDAGQAWRRACRVGRDENGWDEASR